MKQVAIFIIIAGSGIVSVYLFAIVLSWLEAKAQAKVRRNWQENINKQWREL